MNGVAEPVAVEPFNFANRADVCSARMVRPAYVRSGKKITGAIR